MARFGKAGLIVAAVLVATVGLVSIASASSSPNRTASSSKTKTIQVLQSGSGVFTFVDVGPADDSIGDYTVINTPLLHPTSHQQVGLESAVCTAIEAPPGREQCVTTASFPAGDITFQGVFVFEPPKPFVLAITGGTGAYRTAHGTVTFSFPQQGGDLLIVFKVIL
jgi:hypothetical protein